MTTYKRICIKDYVVEAQNKDRAEVKSGYTYITSDVDEFGDVIVFHGEFWAPFPIKLFNKEVRYT